MRLIRVGALFGSLVLLVASAVSLINHRNQLYDDQDSRVTSSATIATNAVQNSLLRARAVVEVATVDSEPEALRSTFDESAEACVGTRCTGPDLAALDMFGDASSRVRAGGSQIVVDVATRSILVVGRVDTTPVSIQLPLDALVGPLAREAISDFGTDFRVATSGDEQGADITRIRSIDGNRVVFAQISETIDDGSVIIRSSVPDQVGWGADNPGLYALLFGGGTVLLVLAGGTALAQNRKLERRATTDELTGLVNRREFERLCEEEISAAGRMRTGLCIMLIDLNGFKQINDTLGHQFGDLVLKGCAERLVDAVRDTDVVGRWGGDEFVVLLPGLNDASGIRNSAERIGHHMSSTPVAGDVSISGSIGAALFPRHGATLGELMQAADVAMYEAKTTGVLHRLASSVVVDASPIADYDGPDRRKAMTKVDDDVVAS